MTRTCPCKKKGFKMLTDEYGPEVETPHSSRVLCAACGFTWGEI